MTDLDVLHGRLANSGWAPPSEEALHKFIEGEIEKMKEAKEVYLPVIQEFKGLIETDPNIYMNFVQMFSEVPERVKVLELFLDFLVILIRHIKDSRL